MHAAVERLEPAQRPTATFVALESFTYSTPSRSAHLLQPVRHAGEAAQRAAHRLRVDARARARRPPPPSRSRGCARRAGASRRRPSAARPPTQARRRAGQSASGAAEATACGPSRRREPAAASTATSLVLVGEHAQLRRRGRPRRCRGGRGGPRVEVQEDAPSRARTPRRPRAGSSTPRRPRSAPGRRSPTSADSGVPTLPATATGSPAAR